MPPLPADFIHAQALQTNLRKTLDTTSKAEQLRIFVWKIQHKTITGIRSQKKLRRMPVFC